MTLTTEQKRDVLTRVSREVVVGGDIDLVDELFEPDYVDHDPFAGVPDGREGFKQAVRMLRGALPDLEVDIEHTLVEGDTVFLHLVSRGTHLGELLGVPPTHERVEAASMEISRVSEGGRVSERWQRFAALQMLQQLGVIPGWQEPPPVPPLPVVEGGRVTSPEENKAIMLAQLPIWNEGDYDVADEIFHPQAIAPDAPQLPVGPEGCKTAARLFRDAFPDFHMTVEDVVAEGDLVACRFRQTGTHRGELFGIAPTGRSVDFGEIALCRIADGRIISSWFQTDMLALMSQLGVGEQQAAPA